MCGSVKTKRIKINNESLIRITLLHYMGNMGKISDNERDDHRINIVIGKKEGFTSEELENI